jgi:hypothetical protein
MRNLVKDCAFQVCTTRDEALVTTIIWQLWSIYYSSITHLRRDISNLLIYINITLDKLASDTSVLYSKFLMLRDLEIV